jgi:hypothetical protein
VKRGDVVVHLHSTWTYGTGTITGVNEIGWLEVEWANGDLGAYPPQHLELAATWERQQVETSFS